MQFTVIIPTYRRAGHLQRLLLSLCGCERSFIKEIFVCEDGRTKPVRKVVEGFRDCLPVEYRSQPHLGFRAGAARNLGICGATGDGLLFIDDDMVLPPHFMSAHVAAHQSMGAPGLVIGLRVRCVETAASRGSELLVSDHRADLARKPHTFARHPTPWYYAYTCNLSVDGRFKDILFDEEFVGWGNEDLDYAYRVWRAGAQISFAYDAWAHQPNDEEACRDPFLARKLGRSADFRSFIRNAQRMALKFPADLALQNVMETAIRQAIEEGAK